MQNYIDDTGVQVADVVVGFTELEGRDLAAVQALADDPATRFDYYCWDLYAKVTEWYEGDKARLDNARARAARDRSTAATRWRRWARSSPTASCAATCGRWRG